MTDNLYNGIMVNEKELISCCFIGHRDFDIALYQKKIIAVVKDLIEDKGVTNFLFGSKSEFNYQCYLILKEFKLKYPYIKLIYIRAEHMHLSCEHEMMLLHYYDDTYFSSYAEKSGKLSYIMRNQELIDKSDYCVFYYDEDYLQKRKIKTNSGTKLAYKYAFENKKQIINIKELN